MGGVYLQSTQAGRSHASNSSAGPILSQFEPPLIGLGFVQFLKRIRVPSPQLALHSDHSDQWVYPPFITKRKKKPIKL